MKKIILAVLSILGYFWAVFVEMTIYNWFIPVIFKFPILSFAEVGGIAVLIGLFVFKVKDIDNMTGDKPDSVHINRMVGIYIYWGFALVIAYIWKQFI